MIVLAVPVPALEEAVRSLGPLTGKIVVDATNAVGTPIEGGHDTVGAYVAELAPDAFLVKAFNTIRQVFRRGRGRDFGFGLLRS